MESWGLGWIDWLVIVGYFLILAGLAWWVIKQRQDTSTDYFLAGRNLGWVIVGASIFASNIGSEHLVGLAGTGATDGVAMAHYELHAWCLLVLGWIMAPFYMRSRVFTMPEFLEKRFTPAARTLLSVISLVAYVLTKIAVGIFAGGIVFQVLLPELHWFGLNSFWIGSILVIIITGIYTILGGLRAVAYTEALQTVVLVFGSIMVLIFGLKAIGGWSELRAIAGSEMFNLWKPMVPDGMESTWAPVIESNRMAWYFNDNYPWLAMLFVAPIVGLWYWTTDQYIVQRVLGAPNEQVGRRGTIAAGFLKLLPVFIFIIPGIIGFALASSGTVPALQDAMIGPDGEVLTTQSQAVFPMLVTTILPIGVRGIVVAGLLAALMSSLAGVFNASATLFTMDFYARIRKNISEERLVWIGRVATGVMVIIGLLWIPVIQGSRGLYDYLQSVQNYLAPPIFVVFFFGVFNKRLNRYGAMSALIVGFIMGIFRLIIDTPVALFEGFTYAEGSFLWILNNMFFSYYALLIFLVSIAVMVGVSYMTEPPDYEKIKGLTYGTLSDEDREESRTSWDWKDVFTSLLLVALIVAIYIAFRG